MKTTILLLALSICLVACAETQPETQTIEEPKQQMTCSQCGALDREVCLGDAVCETLTDGQGNSCCSP